MEPLDGNNPAGGALLVAVDFTEGSLAQKGLALVAIEGHGARCRRAIAYKKHARTRTKSRAVRRGGAVPLCSDPAVPGIRLDTERP